MNIKESLHDNTVKKKKKRKQSIKVESNTSSLQLLTLATTSHSHTLFQTHTHRKQDVDFRCMVKWRAHTTAQQIFSWAGMENMICPVNEHMNHPHAQSLSLIHTHTNTWLWVTMTLTACSAVVLSTMVQCVNNTVQLLPFPRPSQPPPPPPQSVTSLGVSTLTH